MARYQVRGPDGQMHVFEGPEGATPDQVVAVAKQMFGRPKAEAPPIRGGVDPTDGMGTGERLLAGVGMGMNDLYMGAKQRLGYASQAEIDDKRQADSSLAATTAGKVGGVLGKI